MGELRGSDLRVVAEQLGRRPTIAFTVVARCPGGHPLAIRNAPVDEQGNPFPTLFWLTCPGAVRAVSRLEAEGWISKLNERIETDPEFADAVARAHAEYARERARGAPGAEAQGGVGGTRRGLKCLHAHYANHLAGGDDEVGAWVAGVVEPIHDERPGRVAAVDQGTNSIRLLVAEPNGEGGFDELARDMVITRLGQGVDETGMLSPDAVVVERFNRVSDSEILYKFTVTDPKLFSAPWSAEMVFNRSPQPAYEYACHEGNHSMPGILAGARVNDSMGKANYADEGE